MGFLGISIILAVLKIAGVIHWSWLVVTLPIWGYIIFYCLAWVKKDLSHRRDVWEYNKEIRENEEWQAQREAEWEEFE